MSDRFKNDKLKLKSTKNGCCHDCHFSGKNRKINFDQVINFASKCINMRSHFFGQILKSLSKDFFFIKEFF